MPEKPAPRQARRDSRTSAARQLREAEARKRRLRTRLAWGAGGLVVLALIIFAVVSNMTGSANASPTIEGVECNTNEQLAYHIHSHLTLIDEGQPVTLPQGIGIDQTQGCIYWLHTHDTTGVLHVESPTEKQYTLKNFLAIWGKTVDNSYFLTHSVASGHSVRAYVGKDLYKGALQDIVLTPHKQITLEYGPPWVTPQASYAFPSGE